MATTTNLDTLKINYLTQAQYDTALDNNQINSNELYFTPDNVSGKVKQNQSTTEADKYSILLTETPQVLNVDNTNTTIEETRKSVDLTFFPRAGSNTTTAKTGQLILNQNSVGLGYNNFYDIDGTQIGYNGIAIGAMNSSQSEIVATAVQGNVRVRGWNAAKNDDGTVESTNYIKNETLMTTAHMYVRSYSAKNTLTSETNIYSGGLTLNYQGTSKGFNANNVINWDNMVTNGVTLTGTQTLTNKTLTSPTVGTKLTWASQGETGETSWAMVCRRLAWSGPSSNTNRTITLTAGKTYLIYINAYSTNNAYGGMYLVDCYSSASSTVTVIKAASTSLVTTTPTISGTTFTVTQKSGVGIRIFAIEG